MREQDATRAAMGVGIVTDTTPSSETATSPAGTATSPAGTKSRRWHNWKLGTKLTAISLLPILLVMLFGTVQVWSQAARVNEFRRSGQVLAALDRVQPLLASLQEERNAAADLLTRNADPSIFEQRTEAVDKAARELTAALTDPALAGTTAQDRYRELRANLDTLEPTRQQARQPGTEPFNVVLAYNAITTSVLSLDQALASGVAREPDLLGSASGTSHLRAAGEEIRVQQAFGLTGLNPHGPGPLTQEQMQGSHARLSNKLTEARSTMQPYWAGRVDEIVKGPAMAERDNLLSRSMLAGNDKHDRVPVSAAEWDASSDRAADLIDQASRDLTSDIHQRLTSAGRDAQSVAIAYLVAVAVALLLAIVVATVISRQLVSTIRQLRTSTARTADRDLPAILEDARAGRDVRATITSAHLSTTEDVGELSRAVDGINRQTLKLATEHAVFRSGVQRSFMKLSQRTQALLDEQRHLFLELGAGAQTQEQQEWLFQLGHVATRMRRNNENLMVLIGQNFASRFPGTASLTDVLHAAIAEIEHYDRIAVEPPPLVRVTGEVAGDLVRVLAELLDNATKFAPPDSRVTLVSCPAGNHSITIDVLDNGVGVSARELAEANELLASRDHDLTFSHGTGISVVGRLAARHRLSVQLHLDPGNDDGLRATIQIPAEYISTDTAAVESAKQAAAAPSAEPAAASAEASLTQQRPASAPVEDRSQTAGAAASAGGQETPRNSLFVPLDDPPSLPAPPEAAFFDWPEESIAAAEQQSTILSTMDESPTEWFRALDFADDSGYSWPDDRPERTAQPPAEAEHDAKAVSSTSSHRGPAEVRRRLTELQDHDDPGTANQDADRQPAPAPSDQHGTSDDAWSFAIDDAARRAEEALAASPAEYTTAGLPRRVPKAQLAPGSAPANPRAGRRIARDADQLRGQMADFQSGIRRGRHRAEEHVVELDNQQ